MIKLWREGAKLELIEKKILDNETTFVIRASAKYLPREYIFYVLEKNYLVSHYESVHPKHGITKTTLSKYNSQDNILIPARSIIQATDTGRSAMTTNSIQIGVGIYEDYFEAKESTRTTKL